MTIKSKIEFIESLLSSGKIKSAYKETFLALAVGEIRNIAHTDEAIVSKLKYLEDELNKLKAPQGSIIAEERLTMAKPPPPNPENTKNFLTYFRDSEGLKYLTHDFRDPAAPLSREALLQTAKVEFEEALMKYPNVPTGLKRRIEEFAFKTNPEWFIRKGTERHKITQGWSSKEFSEWFDRQVAPDIKHPCRSSKWNKLIIEPFKKSIQVRDSILHEIIEENVNLVFGETSNHPVEIKYDKRSLELADFYTDVDLLSLAIYHIMSSIHLHADKQENYRVNIEYDSEFEEKYKCIKICHVNSKPTKELNDDFLGGDLLALRNTLYGLCNWAIEAQFNGIGYRRYFLFDKSIKKTESRVDKQIEGFTHLLLFY